MPVVVLGSLDGGRRVDTPPLTRKGLPIFNANARLLKMIGLFTFSGRSFGEPPKVVVCGVCVSGLTRAVGRIGCSVLQAIMSIAISGYRR